MEKLQSVLNIIDKNWDDEVSFLQTLGKFPSTLGNEKEIQQFMANTFREMNLETEEFVPDKEEMKNHPGYSPVDWDYENRSVIVGKLHSKGEKTGKSLILQGHIDVVSAEPLFLWNFDPWGSEIINGRMYGRGILDMKSGIAAMVYALKAIQDANIQLGADIILKSVIEEECTGNGALATLQKGYIADGCIIPEPFDQKALFAQVGVIWMQVTVNGSGAHVGSANVAVNAIEKSVKVINALKEYEKKINEEPRHPAFKNESHPLNVNVGRIKGGDWASNVPPICEFEVRIGFYPGKDPNEVKSELINYLTDYLSSDSWFSKNPPKYTFNGFHAHGAEFDLESELFHVLKEAHKETTNEKWECVSSTATTDARFYELFYNIPVTCYGPTGENVHTANEWVDLQSVKETTKTLASFILKWCGIKNNDL